MFVGWSQRIQAGYQEPETIEDYLFLRQAEKQVRAEIAARETQRQAEIQSMLYP